MKIYINGLHQICKVYTKNNYVMRLTGLGNELDNIDFDPSHPANTKNFEQIIGKSLPLLYF